MRRREFITHSQDFDLDQIQSATHELPSITDWLLAKPRGQSILLVLRHLRECVGSCRQTSRCMVKTDNYKPIGEKQCPDSVGMVRRAAPGGNIGKPLMLALGTLLASGALFRGSGAGQTASAPTQPTSDEGAGGLLGGLGGLLNKLQQGGLGNVANSWVGSGQNQPVAPGQLGPALGPSISRCWLRSQASPRRKSPNEYRRSCLGLLQVDTKRHSANGGGVIAKDVKTSFSMQ